MAEKRTENRTENRSQQAQGQQSQGQQSQERGISRSSEQNRSLSRRDPYGLSAGPFSMIRRLQDDFDRFFGGFGLSRGWTEPFGESRLAADWTPAIETFQRGNEFVVRVEAPGVSREDLTVELGDNALTICGERRFEQEEERDNVYQSERAYGSFCRVVPLPEGAVSESASANFKDGVLEIVVQAPSQEVRRGRRLEIHEGTSQKGSTRSEQSRAEQNR